MDAAVWDSWGAWSSISMKKFINVRLELHSSQSVKLELYTSQTLTTLPTLLS